MTNNKAYIFGNGGHAKVIKSIINNNFDVSFISKDDENEIFANPDKYKEATFFIGIGDNQIRKSVFEKCKQASLNLGNCVAPNAYVDQSAIIGNGVFIGFGANILVDAKIGDNVIINTMSNVDHDCEVKDHSQLTAGVVLGGEVKIGESCLLGINSAIIPGKKIGDNCQLMAGSLVTKDFDSSSLLGGYPAKKMR